MSQPPQYPPPQYPPPQPYGQPAPPQPGWVVSPSDGWSAPKGFTPDGRPLATFGKRFLGLLFDAVIWLIPAFVLYGIVIALFVVGAATTSTTSSTDPSGNTVSAGASAAFIIGIFAIYGIIFLLAFGTIAVESELLYRRGRTWGMGWAGLRVIDTKTGGPISRGKAWGRTLFARFISGQICWLGYLWALWDDRSRTLHDLVVGTVVIEEPKEPSR